MCECQRSCEHDAAVLRGVAAFPCITRYPMTERPHSTSFCGSDVQELRRTLAPGRRPCYPGGEGNCEAGTEKALGHARVLTGPVLRGVWTCGGIVQPSRAQHELSRLCIVLPCAEPHTHSDRLPSLPCHPPYLSHVVSLQQGYTPLHLAAFWGCNSVVKVLLGDPRISPMERSKASIHRGP